jgi:HK97 family phage portal protein
MMAWALLWGNAYSKIIRDRFANAKELKILPSPEVTPKMTERGALYYEWQSDKGTEIILSEDIIHLKGLGTNGLVGLSPIQIQRENLANAMAKIDHEGAFYSNGAKASGILMTPGTMGNKEQSNLKSSFEDANSGSKNRFKTIILEEGVKYQQLTIPQNDAQFLESKKFEQTEIAGWFRVPPHMIGNLQDANYSNIDAQDRAFAKSCIVPWTVRFQQEIDRKLFFQNEKGKYMSQFNLDDLIKGDMKTRYEAYQMGINSGFIKPIWATEAEGWPTEGAIEIDNFFMNGANKSVKQILSEPEQQTNAA